MLLMKYNKNTLNIQYDITIDTKNIVLDVSINVPKDVVKTLILGSYLEHIREYAKLPMINRIQIYYIEYLKQIQILYSNDVILNNIKCNTRCSINNIIFKYNDLNIRNILYNTIDIIIIQFVKNQILAISKEFKIITSISGNSGYFYKKYLKFLIISIKSINQLSIDLKNITKQHIESINSNDSTYKYELIEKYINDLNVAILKMYSSNNELLNEMINEMLNESKGEINKVLVDMIYMSKAIKQQEDKLKPIQKKLTIEDMKKLHKETDTIADII